VAAGAKNGSLHILDQTGNANEPYYFHDAVDAVAFSPNSDIVAAATDYGEVRLLDLTGSEIGPAFRGFGWSVHSLGFFPDGLHLAATGYDGTRLIDTTRLAGGRDIRALIPVVTDPGNPVVGAAFIKGQALVAGTESGDLIFWHPETNSVRRSDHAQGEKLKSLAANRQGSMIAGGGSDGRIRLFDAGGKILGDLTPPAGPHWELAEPSWGNPGASLVFSPDGKTLATQHSNQEIILWDLDSRRPRAMIHRMDIHGKDLQGKELTGYLTAPMAFSASGDRLATVFGKTLRFWHLDGTADRSHPLELGQMVVNLAFRPDGKGFVTIEPNNILRRWTMSGHELQPVNTCCSGLFAQWIAVDDKSERILVVTSGSTGLGGGINISVATYPPGENSEIEPLVNYALPFIFRSVALSPEGDAIVTVDDAGVRLWPVNWRATLQEGCERLSGHNVFQNPNSALGLDKQAIQRAQRACDAQLWDR
jgi:WD40 repeat protein